LRRLREKGQMASKTAMIVSLKHNFTIKLYNQDFVAEHTSADGALPLRLEWSMEVIRDTSV